jgi:desulfoferrodoxin (superoxide reductase-like protein)
VVSKEYTDKRLGNGSRKDGEMKYRMCNEFNYVFKAETTPETCPGAIHALSLCNIHGLWESTKEAKIAV